jgi:hypothetical protein
MFVFLIEGKRQVFAGDELRQFADVRRSYHERKDRFDEFWLKLTEKEQREVSF